jgi:hypothetical protein
MVKKKVDYSEYFKVGQHVKLAIYLSQNLSREINGEITAFGLDRVKVEFLGGGMPIPLEGQKPGTKVTLAGWSGWGFYQCDGIFEEIVSAKEIRLKLSGEVEEKQRREYFRLDVVLPVIINLPETQNLSRIREEWHNNRQRNLMAPAPELVATSSGYRAIFHSGKDIEPQTVNLSAGGIRVLTRADVSQGFMVHSQILLPYAPARIISAVSEVLRCNELTLRIENDPAFIAAMKFVHIDEKDREAIISYLFAEQRNQIQSERDFPLPRR